MKKKALIIGGIATTAVLAGGWALAQSGPHGPGGFGPPFMQGVGPGMGPGMMQHMARAMGPGMGPGTMQHMQIGPGMMHGGPGFAFTDPVQIDALKKELGITTAQEPAWTKYTKALQDAATNMKTTRESVDPAAVSKMTQQDRLAFATKMREQGQKQHETVTAAANELLSTLSDAQKAKAQQTLPGLAAFGPGPMRGAFMGGPQHQH
jgi:hypothetical protein